MLSEAKHLCFFLRLLSNPEIDSFVSRLSRCYPRSATAMSLAPLAPFFASLRMTGRESTKLSVHFICYSALAPIKPLDICYSVKVRVPGHNWHLMLSGQRGNPSVVRRNRRAARF